MGVRSIAKGGSMEKYTDARQWCNKFMNEFNKESDRAAVIISAAMLDTALETLVKKKLVKVSKSEENLIGEPYAPISSFAAKINLAYRMGLISANLCHGLHVIRDIRNDFAHNIEECSFQKQGVRARVTKLQKECGNVGIIGRMDETEAHGVRRYFEITIAFMLHSLFQNSERCERIEARRDEWRRP